MTPPLQFSRRAFSAGVLAAGVSPASASEPPHDTTLAQDFDELWTTLRDHYCFFSEKRTDWDRVRRLYRPQAIAAPSYEAFQDITRRVLCELYDAHTHLSDPPDGAPRWPLYDVLAERAGGDVRIAAVQEGSSAADAGVRIGDVVVGVDGAPIERVIADLMPRCLTRPDPEADRYAINVAVAGHTAQPRQMRLRGSDGVERDVALPLKRRPDAPDIESRRLDGDLGYIRIRTFANEGAVAAFDLALNLLGTTRGIVIDVRGNGGGDTAVARPMMGRFITETRPYAHMRRRNGRGLSQPWIETVDPRGPFTYDGKVVVLTDHWSGSMAEGFPMGMRAVAGARIVGTRMMGLGAAVFSLRLDRTGVGAQYSAEPVYDVNDQPRWLLTPDVETAPGADILAAGVAELRRIIGWAG
ncbi:MAG: S41 family peptidase [Terricaulis sp.]